jgi:diguanylate cyclase (GGDEF)-like protein
MTKINKSRGDILIVDDVLENVRLLSAMLSENGYEVRQVLSGKQALKVVNYEPPELILLDIMMPEIDGYEVCQQIKSNPKLQNIPVIFISAEENTINKIKAFEVGGIDYVTKPFFLAEVLCRVQTHINNYRHTNRLTQEIIARQKAQQELKLANQKLAKVVNKLRKLVNLDGLTKISNRRYFDQFLATQWKYLQRENQNEPLSLMMLDIDDFKTYNDTYGHIAGDIALKSVAQLVSKCVTRPMDLVARYGGEEFVVVLPNTNIQGAKQVADRIVKEIEKLAIPHQESKVVKYVTLSIGVSCLIPNKDESPESLIKKADDALFEAKNQGRNCIVFKPF